MTSENVKLVYRFDIYAEYPLGRYYVDVDATTGEIVNTLNRIQHHTNVNGRGNSLYNGQVNMVVDKLSSSSFRLHEHNTRPAQIKTFDMRNGTNYSLAFDFTSTSPNGPWDRAGVSVHWGTEVTYDYFRFAHGRNSVNDHGLPLLNYVHFDANYVNAFWDGTRMTYGDGDGVNFGPLISLDIIGHELGHAYTQFTSNLIYQNESGALNEGFSDIYGNLVEFSKEGNPGSGTGNWHIAEDIDLNPGDGLGFRNMANPNELGQPDTYNGTFWYTGPDDNGGVHTNSGVLNFWFYLLVTGGSGTNDHGRPYNVTGIGTKDAAIIAYRTNESYLTSGATYANARSATIACVNQRFGNNTREARAVKAAWDAVGVYAP